MEIITSTREMTALSLRWRAEGRSIALVPTMGFFHAGHESLMAEGRRRADRLVVSLFVNPTQFGPTEDLDAYPRNAEGDAEVARRLGVDVLFMPENSAMYAPDHGTWVDVPSLADTLCGKSRPAHFRGVCTVVVKLLMLVRPHIAVFGQKDWQQLAVLRRMARDLFIPAELAGMPIVREPDGLAMSSRNAYLTPAERAAAPHLQKGLALAAKAAAEGERSAEALLRMVRAYWAAEFPEGAEDYLAVVNPDSLSPVSELSGPTLMATAVRLGKARLIDNILLHPKAGEEA